MSTSMLSTKLADLKWLLAMYHAETRTNAITRHVAQELMEGIPPYKEFTEQQVADRIREWWMTPLTQEMVQAYKDTPPTELFGDVLREVAIRCYPFLQRCEMCGISKTEGVQIWDEVMKWKPDTISFDEVMRFLGTTIVHQIGFSFSNNTHPDHNGVHIGLATYHNGMNVDTEKYGGEQDYAMMYELERMLWNKIKEDDLVTGQDVLNCFSPEVHAYFKEKEIILIDRTNIPYGGGTSEGAVLIHPLYHFTIGWSHGH